MHLASSEGLLDVVKALVEELGADLSVVDRWQNTPLDDAVRSRHKAVIKYLTSKGAVRTERSAPETTPVLVGVADPSGELCDAAAKGDVDRLRALAAAGAQIDMGDYDKVRKPGCHPRPLLCSSLSRQLLTRIRAPRC